MTNRAFWIRWVSMAVLGFILFFFCLVTVSQQDDSAGSYLFYAYLTITLIGTLILCSMNFGWGKTSCYIGQNGDKIYSMPVRRPVIGGFMTGFCAVPFAIYLVVFVCCLF